MSTAKRITMGVMAAGVLAIVVAGCAPEEEEAVARDTLTIAIGAEPESLDPVQMTSAPAATVGEHAVERLIYMEEDGELTPMLATSWDSNEEGTEWTFRLREGVEFHDGEPFNAEAVKVNLDRFLDPDVGAVYAFLLGSVQEVEVVGEYEVRLHLEEPFAPILSHLSHSFIGMISPAQIEDSYLDDVGSPVGTGPYEMVSWDRGDRIEMTINDNYWGDTPQIENLRFTFISEDSARIVALETGEADAIMAVPPTDAVRLEGNDDIDVTYQTSVRQIYVGFNVNHEPFDNKTVRQALNYAVDKEIIVDTIFEGNAFVADAPIVDAVVGHTSVGPYEYDPDRAREMLAEAGYADGFEVTLYHPTGRYPQDSTVAEIVQDQLADVGVDLTLETMEWSSYLDYLYLPEDESDYRMYVLGWGTVTLDADYGLFALFHGEQGAPAGNNISYYRNDEVDVLLEEARVNTEPAAREALYGEAIELIWDDASWLFLYNEGQINASHRSVEGLIHHPLENLSAWDAYFVD